MLWSSLFLWQNRAVAFSIGVQGLDREQGETVYTLSALPPPVLPVHHLQA